MGVFDKFLDIMKLNDDDYDDDEFYDDDDFDNAANDDNDKTQTFKAVNGENYQPQNNNNNDYNDNQYGKPQNNNGSNKNSEKKSLIIIAILAVLLIAIVSSIAVIAHNKNKDTSTTTPLTKVSERDELSRSSTTKERTTEKTTESTTEKTTKETTKSLWIINTSSSGGGQTQGDGKYENGKTVTLVATAFLQLRTAMGAFFAILPASFRTFSISSACGYTALTRPMR